MVMTEAAVAAYKELLVETLPGPIQSEAENEAAIRKIEKLMKDGGEAEERMADLLTVLVGAFEEERYPAPKKATALATLRHLMDANHLKQKDMLTVFRSPSIVSEVLSGKRGLTLEHIKKLAKRFHVSAEVFI
jgi:HTH-type transcriptional regulator / antitoxin HigA